MANNDKSSRPLKDATRTTRLGREKSLTGMFVNPPVIHASTVLFDDTEVMAAHKQRYTYARRGNPTTEALENALTGLENADGTVLCPSGLSAVSTALLSCLKAGDRLLMSDDVYEPSREFADRILSRYGVETVYYDPAIGADIESLFDERTAAIYLESPGTFTYELQDLPAIAAVARRFGALTVFDNTWASPLHYKPLDHGADIVVEACTKYIVGHSDVSLGSVSAKGDAWRSVRRMHGYSGLHVAPDDVYLGLRGLRTMALRLERHTASAMKIAPWLEARSDVAKVFFPGLPSHEGHEIWKRDMTGTGGLVSVAFDDWPLERIRRFVDALSLFGLGYSWGGYESLVSIADPGTIRTATSWTYGPIVRLFIGVEDADDLIADLDAAFAVAATG